MPALPWTRLADPEPDRDYVVLASRLPLRLSDMTTTIQSRNAG